MRCLKRHTVRYMILIAVVVAILEAIAFRVLRAEMFADLEATLTATATTVAQTWSAALVSSSEQPPIDLTTTGVLRSHEVYIQIWIREGNASQLWGTSPNIADLSTPLDAATLDAANEQYSTATVANVPLRVLTRPMAQGNGVIQIAGSLAAIHRTSDLLLKLLLVGYGVIVASVGVLVRQIAQKTLKPVTGLADVVAHITTAEDLQVRLNGNEATPEIQQLALVLNQLLDRMQRLLDSQRRFIADVSHELRTPLTAVRGNVEIIRRYGFDKALLEAIEVESKRMSQLVNDMLLLAHADRGDLAIDLYPTDLDAIVREVWGHSLILAEHRNLEIRLDRCDSTSITGNADRIKQLVANLVDNAIKFTLDGGQVVIELARADGSAVLQVRDTGIGIAQEDLKRLFTPFFKADPSRTYSGGFGLGLAIAHWIVEAHHGTITVDSQLGRGTLFTVTIPLLVSAESADKNSNGNDSLRKSRLGIERIARELGLSRVTHLANR